MMKRKNLILVIITVFICLFLFFLPTASSSALPAESAPTPQAAQTVQDQVKLAILEAIASTDRYIQKGMVPSLQVTDIKVSQDQQWATAWVVYYDPSIEALIPSEPSLPVSHFLDNQWQVYLPSDPGWQQALSSAPEDLLTQEDKDMWLTMIQSTIEAFPTQSGYQLPWHGGQTAYLSRSVGHDESFPSGTSHFAFDFFLPGTTQCPTGIQTMGTTGLNFDLYASRAGTVWGWKDSVQNCDHSDVNFIVIQNADDPTLYQLYMHLAQNSIPQALKSVGAPVARGQFIAVADNTGNSSGSHLHFQIEHKPYWPSGNPYWNTALDMTFDDVDINGGRPRSSYYDPAYCRPSDICDVFRSTYVSSNYYMGDSTPPIGDLAGVNTGDVISTQSIILNGWAADAQTGLDYGQLMANFEGSWHNLGAHFNPSFTYTWDFCDPQMQVPNGPVSVAMLLYDVAGNPAPLVGLRHFTQNYSCPVTPPSCMPNQDQVTLFEDAFYQGGCVKFNVGNYPTGGSLDPLGDNDAESIMVGGEVNATLYSNDNFTGHSQALSADTAFMKYQWVPGDTLSSMRVSVRSEAPPAPSLTSPLSAAVFREGDVVPLAWSNGGGAMEYQVEIYKGSSLVKSLPWQAAPVGYAEGLPYGGYSWQVQGRNAAGTSPWSQRSTFSIESPIVVPGPESVPYNDDMEATQSKWVASNSGLWSYQDNANKAHSGTHSWWYQNSLGDYDDDHPNSGSLTSPPISITTTGYYLRFYYRNHTETQGTTWDQRWVQISVDGGSFTNLVQIYDDPQMPETSSWMINRAISLSPYAGHVIRVRFQFTTFDAVANNYPGWGIDDFSITANPPSTCGENRQDDTAGQAFLLVYDPSTDVPGEICPNGDYDYYKFYGSAGDRIVADVDAMKNGSLLDAYLFLIDGDGQTVLAENDDEIYAQRRDPLLSYQIQRNGFYYLKLKAWKHPSVGGDNYFYTIRLYKDEVKPEASLTWPASNSYLPDTISTITAQVNEVENGVNRVDFYWHPTDWWQGTWEKLGSDWDGTDGWSIEFSPAGEAEGNKAAMYIEAYDMAGNWAGSGAWSLGIDKTPPVTAMLPLAGTQSSNAFLIRWTGTDNLSGIDHVDVEESVNGGNWTALSPIDGASSSYWIIGTPGKTYSYRMRGVDNSGNSENFPTTAEATTSIPEANIICYALDSYDTSGNDNSPAEASVIYLNGASQFHNFCNPLVPGYQNDEEWIRFVPVKDQRYFIESVANSPQTATIIRIYAQDGTTLLAEATPRAFGDNTILGWLSDRDEPVFLRLQHTDERVIGKEVGGTISVKIGYVRFFPILQRH